METLTDRRARIRRWVAVLLIVLGVVVVDWLTKRYAEEHLVGVDEPYLDGFFRITYAENTGAFLGMGEGWGKTARFVVFTALTSLFLVFVAFTTLRQKTIDRFELVAVSLIIGGGIGNLIDRIVRPDGAVVDFMNMGIGSLRTGIFNVADMALTAGVLIWLLPIGKGAKKAEGNVAESVE